MWLFKGMKRISKSLTALLMATVLSISAVPTALASNVSESETGQVVSHSEEWVSPNKRVEVTVYDLGDGFTATETITDEYVSGVQRASGTKTQTSTVEIKNKSVVAATITVSGTFSYDGSDFKDHKALFEYGFKNYQNYKILKKGKIEILDDTYYKNYDFYIKDNFTYPLSDNEKDLITITVQLQGISIIV